jgi:small multidrug resistance pump
VHYAFLLIAIVAEVIATSALKASDGFSRLLPSVVVIAGYAVAFYFLSLTLRVFPIGIAYAMWSGLGIILISMVGYFHYGQLLDLPAGIGLAFIVLGVIIVNVFSNSVAH